MNKIKDTASKIREEDDAYCQINPVGEKINDCTVRKNNKKAEGKCFYNGTPDLLMKLLNHTNSIPNAGYNKNSTEGYHPSG